MIIHGSLFRIGESQSYNVTLSQARNTGFNYKRGPRRWQHRFELTRLQFRMFSSVNVRRGELIQHN